MFSRASLGFFPRAALDPNILSSLQRVSVFDVHVHEPYDDHESVNLTPFSGLGSEDRVGSVTLMLLSTALRSSGEEYYIALRVELALRIEC